MSNNQPISSEYFAKRFVALCLRSGLSGFPKDDTDQHILLKSVVLTLDKSAVFTEKEINAKLDYWITQVSQIKEMDHGTLRRWLVDAGYLTRDKGGTSYQVCVAPRQQFFDSTVETIDVIEVINAARAEIERKKREYMEKSASQAKGNKLEK